MRLIVKSTEPRSLSQHRAADYSSYDNYLQKDELRAALASEQRNLCCYCTDRIRLDAMKIEHWRCQTAYPELQLIYGNLLGACLGGQGLSHSEQHCDTRKANNDLKWNPANSSHAIETRLRYLSDGQINSTDDEFNNQLDTILGLNIKYLRNNRKAVLESILEWWRKTPRAGQKIEQQLARYTQSAQLAPFSPVAVWFLRQKL